VEIDEHHGEVNSRDPIVVIFLLEYRSNALPDFQIGVDNRGGC
jgi:hypothetical protein